MPLLAGLISSLFGIIASLVAYVWAKKISVAIVAIAACAAALTVLLAVFNGLITPFLAGMFSTSLGQFVGLAFPPIAGTCMASLGICWGACALYRIKVQAIKITASA